MLAIMLSDTCPSIVATQFLNANHGKWPCYTGKHHVTQLDANIRFVLPSIHGIELSHLALPIVSDSEL